MQTDRRTSPYDLLSQATRYRPLLGRQGPAKVSVRSIRSTACLRSSALFRQKTSRAQRGEASKYAHFRERSPQDRSASPRPEVSRISRKFSLFVVTDLSCSVHRPASHRRNLSVTRCRTSIDTSPLANSQSTTSIEPKYRLFHPIKTRFHRCSPQLTLKSMHSSVYPPLLLCPLSLTLSLINPKKPVMLSKQDSQRDTTRMTSNNT